MSFNCNSGSTVVTGGVSTEVPLPSSNQTLVNEEFTTDSNYNTVYTVPAGKIFYLMGFSGSAAANSYMHVMQHGGSVQVAWVKILANSAIFCTSPCPIWKYTAAQNVVIKGTNNTVCNIWGVLVDA